MKILKKVALLILFIGFSHLSFAQNETPSYKDIVTENPDAEADIQVVSDYVNLLVGNNMAKAASLLSEKYMEYGPAANDSINKIDQMAAWKAAHLVRTNEKVSFVSMSYRVLQGPYKGDWVCQWGNYNFTQDGKDVSLPYQVTTLVADGKIEMDRIYFDTASILTSLGYTFIPPVKKK